MLLFTIAYLGGVLTIVSPCVLPVLPFVFARADRPFLTGTLPILGGMACTFAGIATLAAVGGSWAARFNQLGRVAALVLLALFAGTLISRHFGAWLTRPLVALGNRLTAQPGSASSEHVGGGVLLGVATGLLWAPCAGPILGLVLTGAAISGVNLHTSLLLLAYAAGAASSLAVAIFAGGRALRAMKRFLSAGEWIRRALGATVLLSVVAIAFGWDRGALQRLSLAQTDRLEHALLGRLARQSFEPLESTSPMPPMPSLKGATGWLNSPPLKPESLRGKVVVVDFWTYSCINCLRSLPYVKHWYESYKDHGLVVIGMHTPEFAFERDLDNVRRAVADLNIAYPVALDNEFKVW
ncbi:MAG: redoxin family protein, partial [Proteobacteria bacterium]|nr:redoxin family protein [Pseudomonadota bacterium]